MKWNIEVLSRFYSTIAIVALWQLASSSGLLREQILAGPITIAHTFYDLVASGELLQNLTVSLARTSLGLSIALVLGTGLALASSLSLIGERVVDAPIHMARAMPFLALVPFFILWFGIGETPKIALIALGSIFPIYVNLFAGVRGVDKKLLETGKVLGLTGFEQIVHIILPGAMPSFLVGLRYALSFAWLSLVVAEQVNAQSGVGYMVMQAREYLRTDTMVVGLLVYALLGYASHVLVQLLEAWSLSWRPSILR